MTLEYGFTLQKGHKSRKRVGLGRLLNIVGHTIGAIFTKPRHLFAQTLAKMILGSSKVWTLKRSPRKLSAELGVVGSTVFRHVPGRRQCNTMETARHVGLTLSSIPCVNIKKCFIPMTGYSWMLYISIYIVVSLMMGQSQRLCQDMYINGQMLTMRIWIPKEKLQSYLGCLHSSKWF